MKGKRRIWWSAGVVLACCLVAFLVVAFSADPEPMGRSFHFLDSAQVVKNDISIAHLNRFTVGKGTSLVPIKVRNEKYRVPLGVESTVKSVTGELGPGILFKGNEGARGTWTVKRDSNTLNIVLYAKTANTTEVTILSYQDPSWFDQVSAWIKRVFHRR